MHMHLNDILKLAATEDLRPDIDAEGEKMPRFRIKLNSE